LELFPAGAVRSHRRQAGKPNGADEPWEKIMRLQDFRALAIVPALATIPAWAQTAAPVPDFSGIWGHLTWPDTEPPASGPGPVINTSHRNGVSDL
jgi:hypothetical protein